MLKRLLANVYKNTNMFLLMKKRHFPYTEVKALCPYILNIINYIYNNFQSQNIQTSNKRKKKHKTVKP